MKRTAKVEYLRTYTTSSGRSFNGYLVTCSEELKEQMKESPYYREDEETGKPIYFTKDELPTDVKYRWHHTAGRKFIIMEGL